MGSGEDSRRTVCSGQRRGLHVGDAIRSILMLGETSPLPMVSDELKRGVSAKPFQPVGESRRARQVLCLAGYVIDLTVLRVQGGRGAATEAIQSSARQRAVIEQAKGVLMLAFGLSTMLAFALLIWHSQRRNSKVRPSPPTMAHVQEDEFSGHRLRLRLAMERILTNGEAREKRRAYAPATPR